MIITLPTILLLLASIAFGLATVGVPARVNWIGVGLLLCVLAALAR